MIAQGTAVAPAYLTPPKPLLDAAFAPWWKNVRPTSPRPDGARAIVVENDGPPPLALLAKPYVNLGGLILDTGATRLRTLTTRSAAGLRIMDLATGRTVPVQTPAGSRVSPPKWAPDGRTLAFMVHLPEGSRLYVSDLAGRAKPVTKRFLLPALCTDWDWTRSGKALVAVFRPTGMRAMPAPPDVAPSPLLQRSDERKTSLRTYPALLSTAYQEGLLDHFGTGQLATVTPSGALREIGKPMPIESLDASPEGRAFRVTLLERPYSHLMPLSTFPEREVVLDDAGRELVELRKQAQRGGPTDEADDEGQRGGANARRGLAWRPDGALAFLRTVGTGAKRKDRVVLWPFPFAKDAERTLYETDDALSNVRFSPDGATLFLTVAERGADAPARGRRGAGAAGSRLIAVRDGKSVVLKETKEDDREPSSLVSGPSGDVRIRGDAAYLAGTQSYEDPAKDAPRPFLERVSLTDGKRERIWQSPTNRYETATMLDDTAARLLVTRESPTEVPQTLVLDLASKAERTLTENRDYAPDITGAKRETIVVTRADGVKFAVKVTSPPGASRPPALFWIYPREAETQALYDRSKRGFNKNDFAQPSVNSKVALIRLGYAVVEPDVPIVAPRERMNDSYLAQLRNSLSATIDELDRRNLIDRARLACGGHSYGAFSTVNAMCHTPFFKAGIAGDGNYLRALTPFGFQSDPRTLWEARETYLGVSPLLYADGMTGALLMYHGLEDQNIGTFPINSERMFTALESLGKPAQLVEYPYEDHGQIARETLMDQWARFASWLDEYLKK